MDISMEIQQARVHGENFIVLDVPVDAIAAWLEDEVGREVQSGSDYFVSEPDADTYGNAIRTVSFADETGVDVQVIVSADDERIGG
ncbi:MAG: hypothetical protein U5L00_11375 [Desulfovermiculus sp.]|nr:hypothetical protein [Desulfovermiculus sp.]